MGELKLPAAGQRQQHEALRRQNLSEAANK